MAFACPAPNPSAPLLQNLADYLDCHAQALGEDGFKALAGGLIVPALLASCLIIYIAIIGYRLLLGERFGVRDVILAAIRIGLVITFATSWPSFETVIYRVVTDGPAEVASAILQPSGLATSTVSELTRRLQYDYDAIQRLSEAAHPKELAATLAPPTPPGVPEASDGPDANGVASRQTSMDGAGVIFMLSSLGGLVAVRLAAGILLAIGPLIISVALFDGLLGFFEGWVRALAGVALGSIGASIIVTLELAFVEAELAMGDASANGFTPQNLTALSGLFGLAMIAILIASFVVARGFKLPIWRIGPTLASPAAQPEPMRSAAANRQVLAAAQTEAPARAQVVADAIRSQGQRERAQRTLDTATPQGPVIASRIAAPSTINTAVEQAQPLGQSLRRQSGSRRTASTVRRDSRR